MPPQDDHCDFCKKKFEPHESYTGFQTADGQVIACNQCSRLVAGVKERALLTKGFVKNQSFEFEDGHHINKLAQFLKECVEMAEISNTIPRIEEVHHPDFENWKLEVSFKKT